MLLQNVAATDYSLCTGQETSYSNTLRRQITPCVQVRRQVAATRVGDRLLPVRRSGDKLRQHVATTDYSICTGQEISCSNMCRRQITPCVQVRRLVATTRVGDRLLPVYKSGDQLQQHVSAIDYSLCTGQEIRDCSFLPRQGGWWNFLNPHYKLPWPPHSVLIFSHAPAPPPPQTVIFGG